MAAERELYQPDPSERTIAGTLREIANLKENTSIEIASIRKAVELTQAYPTLLDNAIRDFKELLKESFRANKELNDEKFKGIDARFAERDKRNTDAAGATRDSINAAMKAAKDLGDERNRSSELAITKSETATNEKINGQGGVLNEMRKGLEDKINSTTGRITIIEAGKAGAIEQRGDTHSNVGTWLAAAAVAISVASFMLVLIHYSAPGAATVPPIIVQSPAFEAPKVVP